MPTESALNIANIQVEAETKEMLTAIGLGTLEGVTVRERRHADRDRR
jgi:hypothetical protein